MKTCHIIVIIFLLLLSLLTPAHSEIELEEPEWNLEDLSKGDIIEKIFKVKNIGNHKLVINKIRASCDCISIQILKGQAEPNEAAEIKVIYNTNMDSKIKETKYIYIQSNDPKIPVERISVKRRIEDSSITQAIKNMDTLAKTVDKKIKVSLFYSSGCRSCRRIQNVFLPKLVERYGNTIEIKQYDISVLENYLKLMEFEEAYRVKENNPIIVFTGARYFSGKKTILNELEPYMINLIKTGDLQNMGVEAGNFKKLSDRYKTISLLMILTTGFIDGLNPCAFVTIVFLISFLYFLGKTHRELLLIGVVFSLAVFITYLLLGLGIKEILFRLVVFEVISEIIYITAICVVFTLACISMYDAFIYLKHGSSKNMKLVLSDAVRNKIHYIIRSNIGVKRSLSAIFLTGVLVSLLESICTGQVYLPTIMLMIKEPFMRQCSIIYLILYNIAFIIPLLGVALFASLGLGYERLTSFSRKNTFVAKLFLSILFFALGILLILTG